MSTVGLYNKAHNIAERTLRHKNTYSAFQSNANASLIGDET